MEQQKESRVIYTVAGNNAFLDVKDMLGTDRKRSRIELFCVNYKTDPSVTARHFMEPEVFKVIAGDVLRDIFHKVYPQGFVEYKGGPDKNRRIQSRVLKIICDPAKRYPYLITIQNGPGKLGENKTVSPDGPPDSETRIFISRFDMHRMCHAVLDYIGRQETWIHFQEMRKAAKREKE